MDAPQLHPWDQQPGEPPQAYARFLRYLYLGPERTLVKAQGKATNGQKKPSSGGQWHADSVAYSWVSRALAWDIVNLREMCAEVAVIWTDTVVTAAKKALRKVKQANCQPKDFADVLRAIETLSKYVTADAINRVHEDRTDVAGKPIAPRELTVAEKTGQPQ